uniref:Endothelin-converting enzyme 1 n=1 Tax=Glossina brevipalpis TaxID=37001 RepID=A0A1A9W6J9_9MUSC
MVTDTSHTLRNTSGTLKGTLDTLKSTSHTLRSTSGTLKGTSDTLKSTSDKVKSTSDTLRSTSDILKSISNTLKGTSDNLRSTSDTLRSTSDALKINITLALLTTALATANEVKASSNSNDFHTVTAKQIMLLAKSAEIRNYMKTDINACDDFYNYACGNWAKINPANNNGKTGLFITLTNAYDRRIARILMNDTQDGRRENKFHPKVKYFYESCLQQTNQRKNNYRKNLLNIMEEFGGMPAVKGKNWNENKFDWITTIARIFAKYGISIIIGVQINADLTNNEINRLYVGQIDGLTNGKSFEYYNQLKLAWELDLITILSLNREQSAKVADEMIEFAQKLALGVADPNEGFDIADETHLKLLDEITEIYGSSLNLTHFVKTWLGYEYKLPVYEYVENYLRNLRILLKETPPRVIANYIMWEMIQYFRLELEGDNEEEQRTKCVGATKQYFIKYLDHVVYQELLKKDPTIVQEIKLLWQQLKLAFEDIWKSSDNKWMKESTRDRALEKLSAMSFEINNYADNDFEKEFASLTISIQNYFENVVNIMKLKGENYRLKLFEPPSLEEYQLRSCTPAYTSEYNKVMLPVAFLQPRFLWDNVYPAALKYATIGSIIAHEMAHGFDDTMGKYDAKGNLNNWWDRNATEVFALRKECLRQQYGRHRYAGKLLTKTQSQGENIADNVGIRIAYAAYENWSLKNVDKSEYLPHMSHITPSQLFFISAAQVWCTDLNNIWQRIVVNTDVHAPEEIRVRASFANFEAFAEAFNCELGSAMHPHRKCVIY